MRRCASRGAKDERRNDEYSEGFVAALSLFAAFGRIDRGCGGAYEGLFFVGRYVISLRKRRKRRRLRAYRGRASEKLQAFPSFAREIQRSAPFHGRRRPGGSRRKRKAGFPSYLFAGILLLPRLTPTIKTRRSSMPSRSARWEGTKTCSWPFPLRAIP